MNKKKGFTLIELLAVIIILGLLMLIAIPSVTGYISDSRKKTYISTIEELINGARNMVNSGEYDMFDTNVSYYIPVSCVETETARTSPYGELVSSYVIANYDNDKYDYYYVGTDSTGIGIPEAVSSYDLKVEDLKSGIKEENVNVGSGVDGRRRVGFLDDTCNTKDVETTISIPQGDDGKIINKGRAEGTIKDDGHDNFRYVGKTPNNYAKFEDSSKTFRIIGYFDGSFKLIDMDGFNMAYDSVHHGMNWNTASLKEYLDGTYYNSLSAKTKSAIKETNWYYNHFAETEPYKRLVYDTERNGSLVVSGKVAMMYGSDFIYATDDTKPLCVNTNLFNLNYCNKHWLNTTLEEWILLTMNDGRIFWTMNGGDELHPYDGYPEKVRYVRPVFYLKDSTKLVSGEGTESSPYVFR